MDSVNLDYLEDYIDNKLLDKLKANKIEQLFPVQKTIIPLLVNQFNNLNLTKPHDICVCSPTGSGEAFFRDNHHLEN